MKKNIKTNFNEFVNEKYEFIENKKEGRPEIFNHTIYRLPTTDELIDVNSYDLSSESILNGFKYTIIGRGLTSKKNIDMIIQSIQSLCDLYPNNEKYKESLQKAKEINTTKLPS